MLGALVKKEARLALRARRVMGSAVGVALLAAVAAGLGVAEHRARDAAYQRLSEFGEARFSGQKPNHPHAIAHNGYVVARAPAPLGFLDAGLEDAYGRWLRLDAHQMRPLQGARTADLVRAPGGGRFDLGLLLALLAPIFVVLLGFDLIAGEKARGNWAMLRAAGVRALPFAISKVAGLGLRVFIAIGIPAAVAAVVASAALGIHDAARIAIWLAVHAVALSVWVVIVLSISALAQTPRGALLGGVALWGALALFVPPLAGGVARAFAPVAPPGEAMVRAATWAESAHAQTEALRARAVRDIRGRHPEWNGKGEAPEVVDAVMLRLADQEAAQKTRALFRALDAEQDRQERLAAALSVTSPTGLCSLASSAVAGSDLAHMRAALEHYELYRIQLMGWFNGWWAQEGRGGFGDFEVEKDFANFEAAPRPTPLERPLSRSLGRALLPVGMLLGLGLLVLFAFFSVMVRQLGSNRAKEAA